MNGGPSQVDTFDPKPALEEVQRPEASGAQLKTERRTGGLHEVAVQVRQARHSPAWKSATSSRNSPTCADDLCVIRSMHTNIPNHEPSLLMMTCGDTQPMRPSMGSWLLYGLGSENQNLPGFVVLCPGQPVVGPQLWSNSFLPGIYQGTHINNSRLDPKSVIANVCNAYLPRAPSASRLDLLKQLNEQHLARAAATTTRWRRASSRWRWPSACSPRRRRSSICSKETKATRELYGTGAFADACLTARRLVERGVRVVQIFTATVSRGTITATFRPTPIMRKNTDQPIAALLTDLKAARPAR